MRDSKSKDKDCVCVCVSIQYIERTLFRFLMMRMVRMSICFWPTARVSIWICSCTRDGVGRASAEASGKSERLSKRLMRCRPRSKNNGSCLLLMFDVSLSGEYAMKIGHPRKSSAEATPHR